MWSYDNHCGAVGRAASPGRTGSAASCPSIAASTVLGSDQLRPTRLRASANVDIDSRRASLTIGPYGLRPASADPAASFGPTRRVPRAGSRQSLSSVSSSSRRRSRGVSRASSRAPSRTDSLAQRSTNAEADVEDLRRVTAMFRQYDVDGSNEITIDELREVVNRLGSGCSESELQARFRSMDLDGDGVVTQAEFLAWWKQARTFSRAALLPNRWQDDCIAVALRDYHSRNKSDLWLDRGDIIEVNSCGDGRWWTGTIEEVCGNVRYLVSKVSPVLWKWRLFACR